MRIHEIMTRKVIIAQPETKVSEIARLIIDNRVGSIPIIDKNGQLVGIISDSDLFLKDRGIPFSYIRLPHIFQSWVGKSKLEEIYKEVETHKAEEIMTSPVISLSPEDDLEKAAQVLVNNRISRIPIVEDGQLVGILSRSDIIKLLATKGESSEK